MLAAAPAGRSAAELAEDLFGDAEPYGDGAGRDVAAAALSRGVSGAPAVPLREDAEVEVVLPADRPGPAPALDGAGGAQGADRAPLYRTGAGGVTRPADMPPAGARSVFRDRLPGP